MKYLLVVLLAALSTRVHAENMPEFRLPRVSRADVTNFAKLDPNLQRALQATGWSLKQRQKCSLYLYNPETIAVPAEIRIDKHSLINDFSIREVRAVTLWDPTREIGKSLLRYYFSSSGRAYGSSHAYTFGKGEVDAGHGYQIWLSSDRRYPDLVEGLVAAPDQIPARKMPGRPPLEPQYEIQPYELISGNEADFRRACLPSRLSGRSEITGAPPSRCFCVGSR